MNKKHNCDDFAKAQDDFHVAGCGETLEKNWKCKKCGKEWREVYIYSCMINNKTDEEM